MQSMFKTWENMGKLNPCSAADAFASVIPSH